MRPVFEGPTRFSGLPDLTLSPGLYPVSALPSRTPGSDNILYVFLLDPQLRHLLLSCGPVLEAKAGTSPHKLGLIGSSNAHKRLPVAMGDANGRV